MFQPILPLQQAAIYRGPRSDEYETPPWIFDPLHGQYLFKVDLAGTKQNRKVTEFYSAENSFLQPFDRWDGIAWCNPPFSLAEEFFRKIAHCVLANGSRCVCIYKSSNMETEAWRQIFSACSWIAQPHSRVNYLVDGVEADGVQFASAVIGFNVDRPIVSWPHTLLKVVR